MTTANMNITAIAINRFGLGMRPDDTLNTDPKKWLLSQFEQYQVRPSAWQNQAKSSDLIAEFAKNQMEMRNADNVEKKSAQRLFRRSARDNYVSAVNAQAEAALRTPTPFIERLVHFWSNHFAISVEKPAVIDLVGAFELEAIRPYVLGNFKDLLLAVEQHPTMLLYLDQAKSIGPNSRAASRLAGREPDKKHGLNENLAREIMELHTLGVRSGYTQADVTEFARALTGWSVAGSNHDKNVVDGANGFTFRPQFQEPGSRTIIGKTYAQTGKAQGDAILADLASAQATAMHISTKLARHFVSDTPPPSLIDKLAQTFITSKGNLNSVYRTLIDAPEAWQPASVKFKTPWEWLISCTRGLGRQNLDGINIVQMLNQLGQPVWKPGSPAGYDDIAETWAAPNALLRRVKLAQRLAALSQIDARNLADKLLLGAVSKQTLMAISRSESATTGLALLLVSPEFLRR